MTRLEPLVVFLAVAFTSAFVWWRLERDIAACPSGTFPVHGPAMKHYCAVLP